MGFAEVVVVPIVGRFVAVIQCWLEGRYWDFLKQVRSFENGSGSSSYCWDIADANGLR